MKTTKNNHPILTTALCALVASSVSASASTFANITVDGDFTDWSGITPLVTDASSTGDPIDFTEIYAANDNDYLYLRVVYGSAVNPNGSGAGPFLAIDNDNNVSTGFDVFGLAAVGSEVGWQNDFPFEQSSGTFNAGGITDGGAGISPFFSETTEQEYRISRSATFTSNGQTIFPNDTIGIAFYTTDGTTTDFIGGTSNGANYTFAVPEPSQAAILIGALALGLTVLRRRR